MSSDTIMLMVSAWLLVYGNILFYYMRKTIQAVQQIACNTKQSKRYSRSCHWIDGIDNYVCPFCGCENANPYKTGCRCVRCGFVDPNDIVKVRQGG